VAQEPEGSSLHSQQLAMDFIVFMDRYFTSITLAGLGSESHNSNCKLEHNSCIQLYQ
jgi:hypothetical protein